MFVSGSITQRVYTLLINVDHLKDSVRDTISYYRNYYPTDTCLESSIERAWRFVQQEKPELRGKGWQERQKHVVCIGRRIRFRNLGQYEDVSDMILNAFKEPKKNWFQKLISKWF